MIEYVKNIQSYNPLVITAFFVFGNMLITLLSTALCWVFKRITIIYNFFGVITSATLMATFINLLILVLLSVVFNLKSITIMYIGIFITVMSLIFVAINSKKLLKAGKELQVKDAKKNVIKR